MEGSNSKLGTGQASVPLFKAEPYGIWSLLENGTCSSEDETQENALMEKDARALHFIQQALDEKTITRISEAQTAKEAWDLLKMEHQGSTKIVAIRQLGDTLTDQTVVGRVLRSLTPRFHHVVSSIIEAQDLTTLTVEQLGGSLHAHEARLNLYEDNNVEEKAFEAKVTTDNHAQAQFTRQGNHGHGRGPFRGREEAAANIVEEVDEGMLFMAGNVTNTEEYAIRMLDSGCSNHMKGTRALFQDLDLSLRQTVQLGDNKELEVVGIGTVALPSSKGETKLLKDVQYVPQLAHNFLSIGQLLQT
ncbi:uncharacterized protein LOC120284169 [Dioscorea cayenensis subsp. rotundata]|uniref:Uncharacterized protein LOC120284169 n=1 Tax=Dioscorea cayennensis subsp. rotundata TaxID=55577 RepID=A0AB40D6V6_DIOCR|nr:uncharacterized protein LOC120284169 [Dioscorea cayenensis subsp. rotundata]